MFSRAAVRAERCKRSLKEFLVEFWHVIEPSEPFVDNWTVDCFCDHLQAIDDYQRLLVNVCPGATKSSIFSVMFPAWKWVNDPSRRFLFASYDLNPAIRDNRRMRDLLNSEKFGNFYPGLIELIEDQNEKRYYENTKTGYRQCTSVNGGAVTGLKANYLVLDDPHQASEANSPSKRQQCIDWFCDVFINRLSNFATGSVIVIGQRIHNNDLSGYIQENYSDFTVLNLPYEYKPTTFISPIGWSDPRTEPGEPLWESRFPAKVIKDHKKRPVSFAAQWNQSPTDTLDNPIKSEQFRYFVRKGDVYDLAGRTVTKEETFRLTCIDPAMSESKDADFTAIATVDVTADGNILLIDLIRERLAGTKLIPTLHSVSTRLAPNYILVETYGFGKLICEQARMEGLPVRAVSTLRGASDLESIKFIRSLDLQDALQLGKLWFLADAPFLPALEQELLDFPGGKYYDQVDAISYICKEARMRTRFWSQAEEVVCKPEPTEEDLAKRYWEMVWAD